MKPYSTIRLEEWPDVDDIKTQGRNRSAGGKDYFKNKWYKKHVRRGLKRINKQRLDKEMYNDILSGF